MKVMEPLVDRFNNSGAFIWMMRKEVIFLLILMVVFVVSCSQDILEENIAGEAGKVNHNLPRTYRSCVDSDGGNNPKILGTITVQYKELGKQTKETQRDACELGKLREYYCEDKVPKSKNITCLYGCLNGVCKQKTPSCTAGPTGNYRCTGNVREQEIRNVTCSIKWQNVTNCQYGCSNNDCQLAPTTICSGNNITGGDGSYNVCVGNTVYHQLSGILATLLSLDEAKINLSLSGLPGNNVFNLVVYKDSTGEVGGNNGLAITYRYNSNSSRGANITISTNSVQNPPASEKKFLTVIDVLAADDFNYTQYWTGTLKTWGNDNVQIFTVVEWDSYYLDNPNVISVYKFNRTFNPQNSSIYLLDGGQAWVDYREQFNILNVEVPGKQSGESWNSPAYLNAFKVIFNKIVENQPAEHYALKYTGHGTSEGALFGYRIFGLDTELLLAYFNSLIGKKIDFLDWSSQCGMGTFRVVNSEYKYADYIVASDIERGGLGAQFGQNISELEEYDRLQFDGAFNTFFSPSKTIRQSLIDGVNSERKSWELPLFRNSMTSGQVKQSLSIYDTSKFEALANSTNLEGMADGDDVLSYIRTNYPAQEQKFYDFRFYYVDDKDFFPWDIDYNGFRK